MKLDVKALCDKDGNTVVMPHMEQAGMHSGALVWDCSCCCSDF